ncbi:MAG: hypothetical protein AAFQ62_06280 [Pseudomonadota bacterium]
MTTDQGIDEPESEYDFSNYLLPFEQVENLNVADLPPPPDERLIESVYPEVPAEVLAANIAAAKAGDRAAQWTVFTVLDECYQGPTSEAGYREIYNANYPPSTRASQLWVYQRCLGVHDQLEDVQSERNHWLSQAALNGYPTAIVYQALFVPPQDVDGLPPEVVYAALQTGDSRAFLAAGLYKAIAGEGLDKYDEVAWGLLACRASTACSNDEIAARLAKQYVGYEIKEMEERADQIFATIKDGELEKLF